MVSHLSKRFDAWARGWIILALVATFIAFEELTLPILQSAPGGSIVSLDAQIFYRPEQAFSTIAAYGDSAQFWIRAYLTWDVANPILYTLVFGLLLSWLFQRGVSPASPLRRLNVLPVGAGCCDLLENACIVTLLAVYPAQPRLVAWLAAVCTLGKVSLLAVSTLLVAIGFVNAALNRFARKL